MPPRGPFCEDQMNVYKSLGYAVGTPEALALAARISAWHDAMVAHQRPADTARVTRCDDDCPHVEARALWHEAVEVFFFFKQKTAYEIGLGIPAEPLFRS